MVLGKNIAHDMKSGAEGAHFFGALLLTFSFDKHTPDILDAVFGVIGVAIAYVFLILLRKNGLIAK